MRVFLLAGIMVCVAAGAANAQASKMNPLPYGGIEAALAQSRPVPASITVDVQVAQPIVAINARLTEFKAHARVAPVKVAVARIEPVRTANATAIPLGLDSSAVTQVENASSPVAALEPAPSPAPRIASADAEPSKMAPALSAFQPIIYAALQPSKMGPEIPGLTGAMRYIDSPWLDHAINDLGTNPTGWKRVWCARSLNMWLQQSGKKGCGSDAAISCLEAGERLPEPKVGAIAVLKHHVGIVKEIHDRHVTLVSGNNRGRPGARTVGVSKFQRASIVGYVWPE